MNALCQTESLLIGAPEAVEEFEKKESVRLLVVSDTHGEGELLEAIIKTFGPECDALFFAGDGCWDVAACLGKAYSNVALKEALPPVLALVRGNGDEEQYRITTGTRQSQDEQDSHPGFPVFFADRQIVKAAGRKIFLTHGHRQRVEYGIDSLVTASEMFDCDMVFFGHTHRPCVYEEKMCLLLNPGSCARPRGEMPATFAVVEYPSFGELYNVQFYAIDESFGKYRFSRFCF
ncbi:MAG: YfcE family phosphodiesterase [Spirochaetaceae bacterium]|jgi:putative phosphoesterase|nr:YfcE family phosphodiesterase [Spirochaetaceae bacterium]